MPQCYIHHRAPNATRSSWSATEAEWRIKARSSCAWSPRATMARSCRDRPFVGARIASPVLALGRGILYDSLWFTRRGGGGKRLCPTTSRSFSHRRKVSPTTPKRGFWVIKMGLQRAYPWRINLLIGFIHRKKLFRKSTECWKSSKITINLNKMISKLFLLRNKIFLVPP